MVYGGNKMNASRREVRGSKFRSLRLAWHRLTGRKTTKYHGLCVICDPMIVPRSVSTAIIKGTYEAPEMMLVESAVRPGDRVLEIGTGVGIVSLLCNRIAGEGNVISYEANASLEPIILENFRLNGINPRLVLKAVTLDGNPIEFFHNDNIISSSVHDRGLPAQKRSIESIAINDAIFGNNANVLVVDIEGGEVDLLPSADLTSVRELIIELHPHIVGDDSISSLITSLVKAGFKEKSRIGKNIHLSRRD